MESDTRKTLMSSSHDEWPTPQDLFDELDAEFHFNIDPCATPENAKCPVYITKAEDGLSIPWDMPDGSRGIVFCNPPYGKEIGKWVKKAWEEARDGNLVVLLVPTRSSSSWWQYCMSGELRFIKSRLHFNDSENPSTFGSVVVVLGVEYTPKIGDGYVVKTKGRIVPGARWSPLSY